MRILVSSSSTSSRSSPGCFSWTTIKWPDGASTTIPWRQVRTSFLSYRSLALIWICRQTSSSRDTERVYAQCYWHCVKWVSKTSLDSEGITCKRARTMLADSEMRMLRMMDRISKETQMLLIWCIMSKPAMTLLSMMTSSLALLVESKSLRQSKIHCNKRFSLHRSAKMSGWWNTSASSTNLGLVKSATTAKNGAATWTKPKSITRLSRAAYQTSATNSKDCLRKSPRHSKKSEKRSQIFLSRNVCAFQCK